MASTRGSPRVKKINGKRAIPSSSVDGCSLTENIAEILGEKYQDVYNSVAFNQDDLNNICKIIDDRISNDRNIRENIITVAEIASVIYRN